MRTAAAALFCAAYLVLITPFILVCLLVGLRDPLIAAGLWAVRACRRILAIEVEMAGLERLDPKTPSVFMSNHESFLDGPLLLMVIPGAARVILKKSVLRIPVLGMAMRHAGYVPVDRRGAEGGKRSIARAAGLMRERGYSFLIFPEGTRSRDGRLGPFRRGGFFLALAAGAPVVPVTVRGTFELMPKGQPFARKGKVEVVFHEPVPVAGHTAETMAELMDSVRRAILGPGAGD